LSKQIRNEDPVKGRAAKELQGLRQKIAELETQEAHHRQTEQALRESEEKYKTLAEHLNVGIYRNTPGPLGKFIEANPAIVKMFGYESKEEFLAINVADLYQSPSDRERFSEKILREGSVRNEELKLKKSDGTSFIGSVSAVAVFDESGQVKYMDGIIDDITERKRMEEALRASEKRFRALIEHGSDVIALAGFDGTILYESPSADRIFGHSSKERFGKSAFDRIHPDDLPFVKSRFARLLAHPGESVIVQVRTPHGDGSWHWTEAVGSNLLAEPSVQAIVINFRDISERKRTEEALRESEERYRTLFDRVPIGLYRSTPEGKVLDANPALVEMLGLPDRESIFWSDVTAIYVNSEDRLQWKTLMERQGVVHGFDTQLRRCDGTSIWVKDNARTVKDAEGRVLYYEGSLKDITEQKQAEEQIARKNLELKEMNDDLSTLYNVSSSSVEKLELKERLSIVLKTVSELEMFKVKRRGGIFLLDGDRLKLICSLGYPDKFLKFHKNLKVGDCLCGLAAKTGEIIISENSASDSRHTLGFEADRPHGHVIVPLKTRGTVTGVLFFELPLEGHMDERTIKLLEAIGNHVGIAIENSKLYEETKRLSLRDPLTGLANRRHMNVVLENNVAIAERYGKPFSVIMLDIDYFKKYNDAYGHVEGDLFLVRLATTISKKIRKSDVAARFGGEEFVVILPETEFGRAYKVAERLRKAIEKGSEVTVSLGVSTFRPGMGASELIKDVDHALYKAKENGRNRVEHLAL